MKTTEQPLLAYLERSRKKATIDRGPKKMSGEVKQLLERVRSGKTGQMRWNAIQKAVEWLGGSVEEVHMPGNPDDGWVLEEHGLVHGWRVRLSGKTYIRLPEVEDAWQSAQYLSAADTLNFLDREVGWGKLAAEALGMDEFVVPEEHRQAGERSLENTGSCGVCFANVKLREGKLVLHGYERPGDGQIAGRCIGTGLLPYEVSTDGLEAKLDWMREELPGVVERIRRLENDEVGDFDFDRITKDGHERVEIRRGHPQFEMARQRELGEKRTRRKRLEATIAVYEGLVAGWRPRPLPGVRDPKIIYLDAEKTRLAKEGRVDILTMLLLPCDSFNISSRNCRESRSRRQRRARAWRRRSSARCGRRRRR